MQQQIIKETFQLVSKRDDNVCNFLEGGTLIGGSDFKLAYRHYATLYFVFCVDSSESELGILDLIQVFVETLDKCFENVCELDLIFHVDKVRNNSFICFLSVKKMVFFDFSRGMMCFVFKLLKGSSHFERTCHGWHGPGNERCRNCDENISAKQLVKSMGPHRCRWNWGFAFGHSDKLWSGDNS